MGSLLEIVGNHKLTFSSGKNIVNQFQSIFDVEIKNGTYQSHEVKDKHEDLNKIEYFVALDYLEQNFDRWNKVKLMTNYKFCSEINIHRKTLSFSNGCRYKYWNANLFEEEYDEKLKAQHDFCEIHWNEVHKYSVSITNRVEGDLQIYFEDSRFQEESDMCCQGKPLSHIFQTMQKKWKPTELNETRKRKDEFHVKYGWYYEKLKTE